VVEMATHINDPAFARAVAERLDEPDRSSATPEAAEAGESISVERLPTEVANAEKMRRFKRITRPATPVA